MQFVDLPSVWWTLSTCDKCKVALTGELTLRGKVLPVGGIKEKILAAKRSGINQIVLSKKNKKDILEINKIYLKRMPFYYVDTLKEVIDIVLLAEKVKNNYLLMLKLVFFLKQALYHALLFLT